MNERCAYVVLEQRLAAVSAEEGEQEEDQSQNHVLVERVQHHFGGAPIVVAAVDQKQALQ